MDKGGIAHVETTHDDQTFSKETGGNVELFRGNEVVLIPTPSADPRDPLNLPPWRKWILLSLISAYSCTAVVLASGLGSIFTIVEASYPGQEARANDLMTYPTLFMGIGNLIAMPWAFTLGRRPVFLASMLLLICAGIWCQCSTSLTSHIAGRNIMSLAAGQSEALSPMIVQEIHFLHERGRKIAWFIFLQNIASGVFFVVSTYMVSAWGWRWWYGFFNIMNALIFVLSVVFVTESHFERSEEAMRGEPLPDTKTLCPHGTEGGVEQYEPRRWRDDLKPVVLRPRLRDIPTFYKHVLQGFLVPTTLWLLLLNGANLGVYVFQASTFARILMTPPYSFSFNALGYVQAGQLVDCLIFLPLLGYGSDWVIGTLSRRYNGGLYKPEYRLPVLAIPAIVGVICALIYGQAAANPEKWSVASIVIGYNASYFAFLGANIVGITYAVDSFPFRAAPFLVVICAGRGLISFGLSYATLPTIATLGYGKTMIVEAVICGVLALLAIPMFFVGPRIRKFVQRWCDDNDKAQ
ncbi:hypothetical protein N7474_003336 [Penicillium riverlandense]|uniref:uncharacterized protein n=1 Tax=Penicillium riverlandense TaxID=1903569 RepID=UPI0025473673|nr:uncharacterized protein N7474_003336 [Penicillium riverlandense]KAJ5826198.1 hypothetical protein N7474_003336 [Penicillium riverlandense]